MTSLYLMRHTQPEPGHPDNADRPLTEAGKQQAEDMGAWLAGHIGRVDIVIHSPFVRAIETAKAMGKALGAHLADTRLLVPASEDMRATWDEITRLAQASKDVLVVGHDPSLNRLALWLMGCEGDQEELRLDWGSVAYLQIDSQGNGQLMWLVTPQIVLADKEIIEAARAAVEELDGP